MDYSYLHARYNGRLLLGLVDTKLLDCRPFAWMSSAEFSLGFRFCCLLFAQMEFRALQSLRQRRDH